MRRAVWIPASLIALCVAVLLTDYAVATRRTPNDDRLIKALQEQVKADAQLAPKLAVEQKRVTAARLARKSRDNAIAWVLILAAAVFLTAAKRVVGPRLPKSALAGESACPTIAQPSLVGQALSPANLANASPPPIDLFFVDELVAQE